MDIGFIVRMILTHENFQKKPAGNGHVWITLTAAPLEAVSGFDCMIPDYLNSPQTNTPDNFGASYIVVTPPGGSAERISMTSIPASVSQGINYYGASPGSEAVIPDQKGESISAIFSGSSNISNVSELGGALEGLPHIPTSFRQLNVPLLPVGKPDIESNEVVYVSTSACRFSNI